MRGRLGLDSAYVSRMLRSLESHGLVVVEKSDADGRVRIARLTIEGLRERAELDHRAEDFAWSLLEPLSESQRLKLVKAMAEVERLLIASIVQIAPANPTSFDVIWCFEQYFKELGERFEAGFDPELSISADAPELTLPAGLVLVARLREEPVGCAALKFHEDTVGEIKRMWVAPRVRGLGLGRRLLETLEHKAREAGMTIIHLETNHNLIEAIQLYRDSGYREVEAFNDEPYAHHWFEKRL